MTDISGMDLAHEIQNVPDLPSDKMTAFELLSFLCEKHLEELYPNLFKMKAHQKLPEVFHVTGTSGHQEYKS